MNELKNYSIILGFLAVIVLSSCGASHHVSHVGHQDGRGIKKIDDLIVAMKAEYYSECYEPLQAESVPENHCQHKLFGVLERRYRLKMNDKFMNMAANDVFFANIGKEVKIMVRRDKHLRSEVLAKFNSHEELISYYKSLYAFK